MKSGFGDVLIVLGWLLCHIWDHTVSERLWCCRRVNREGEQTENDSKVIRKRTQSVQSFPPGLNWKCFYEPNVFIVNPQSRCQPILVIYTSQDAVKMIKMTTSLTFQRGGATCLVSYVWLFNYIIMHVTQHHEQNCRARWTHQSKFSVPMLDTENAH